jgi:hypothetical protein
MDRQTKRFRRALFKLKLNTVYRGAKDVGKRMGLTDIQVLRKDPRYQAEAALRQAGQAAVRGGVRTPKQKAALKKAQAAAAVANRRR